MLFNLNFGYTANQQVLVLALTVACQLVNGMWTVENFFVLSFEWLIKASFDVGILLAIDGRAFNSPGSW